MACGCGAVEGRCCDCTCADCERACRETPPLLVSALGLVFVSSTSEATPWGAFGRVVVVVGWGCLRTSLLAAESGRGALVVELSAVDAGMEGAEEVEGEGGSSCMASGDIAFALTPAVRAPVSVDATGVGVVFTGRNGVGFVAEGVVLVLPLGLAVPGVVVIVLALVSGLLGAAPTPFTPPPANVVRLAVLSEPKSGLAVFALAPSGVEVARPKGFLFSSPSIEATTEPPASSLDGTAGFRTAVPTGLVGGLLMVLPVAVLEGNALLVLELCAPLAFVEAAALGLVVVEGVTVFLLISAPPSPALAPGVAAVLRLSIVSKRTHFDCPSQE